MENNQQVGSKIKAIRESKGLTIEDVAERSSLSTEQIYRIEEDIELPSLAPLIAIARVLGVRLGTFLDDHDEIGPVVCKNGEKDKSISFSNNADDARKHMGYYSLAKSKSGRHMEPFIIEVTSSGEELYAQSSHEGEEFIYVLEGSIEINYGKKIYRLSQGDSIYYDSIVAHHVHAISGESARIMAVVYTPF
ncbi:MAG: cupin domain-containing protein [Bacteroidales bacterium]|nr:cupin domain-containing protein [Bacteroidales bacterium]